LNSEGRPLWRKNFPDFFGRTTTAQTAVGNVVGDKKPEIIALFHGVHSHGDRGTSPFFMLDSRGQVLTQTLSDQNFYSVAADDVDTDTHAEILLSSATRGHYFYMLDAQEGAIPSTFSARKPDKIDVLRREVESKKGVAAKSDKAVQAPNSAMHVLLYWNIRRTAIEEIRAFLDKLSTPSLQIELMVTGVIEEDKAPRDEYKMSKRFKKRRKEIYTQKEILERIKVYEQSKIPFYVLLGTHRNLHMRLDTMEKILKLAPVALKGFIVNEDIYDKAGEFEMFLSILDKIFPLLERHGRKKLIMNEYQDFWYKTLHNPRAFNTIFKRERRDILVPMYKTNNFKGPELNVGTILGVWKAGLFEDWGVSAQDDSWKWESIFMEPPHDILLRMEVMAASLGATYFRIEANGDFYKNLGKGFGVTEGAKRHRDLFHELCRQKVIRPVDSSDQVLISPVMLQIKPDQAILPRSGVHQDIYWQNVYRQSGPLAYGFPLQVAREDYLPKSLYDLEMYCNGFFPKTIYGFVGMVPASIDPLSISGTKDFWLIEGQNAYKKGGKKTLVSQTRQTIISDFDGQAKNMPFRAEGVFLVVNQFDDHYRVYLADPGYLDISDVKTTLEINLPGKSPEVTDFLSGRSMSPAGKKLEITVPAGAFRVLKVRETGEVN
jgi:hypothetical protein